MIIEEIWARLFYSLYKWAMLDPLQKPCNWLLKKVGVHHGRTQRIIHRREADFFMYIKVEKDNDGVDGPDNV